MIDALRDLEILDDTLIYVIIGDNGASAEGSLQGTYNEMVTLQGFGHLETAEFLTDRLDKFGGVESYNHYAAGWAHSMNTPYQWSSRWLHTSAALATARSSIGQWASMPRVRFAASSIT